MNICTCGQNYKLNPIDCPAHGSKNAAFDIVTRHGDALADDANLDDLISDIAAAIDREKQARKSQVSAVVHTVGGVVDGYPTQTINYLQRLRQLVDFETDAMAAFNALVGLWKKYPGAEPPDDILEKVHGAIARAGR